jgi:hypothetical protein
VSPFFVNLLSGFLVLFLLHLGYMAGANFAEIKRVGASLAVFGVLFPILSGVIGVSAGTAIGLSVGGATMLGVYVQARLILQPLLQFRLHFRKQAQRLR